MDKRVQQIIKEAIANKSEFLDLGNCGLRAIPPEISDLPSSITHINFGTHYHFKNNELKETRNAFGVNIFSENAHSLSFLKGLPHLKKLELRDCNLRSGQTEYLKDLKHLTSLDISGNQIGDPGAQHLAQLTDLTSLYIGSNQIGEPGAQHLAQLTNLTSLYISYNQIGEHGAQHLAQLSNLTSLYIGGNQIGEHGAQHLAQLSNLTSLNIGNNQIGEPGAQHLAQLSNLTTLEFSGNQIGDKGAEQLAKLSNLTSLHIGSNQIGDPGAQHLAQLTNLTSLYIGSNQINHTKILKSFKSLIILHLSNNPIKDIPEFVHSIYNCIYELKIWWDETADEEKLTPNELVKLQVIGNGNAGKSSTIEALINGECTTNFESTHGIVIEPLNYSMDKEKIHFQVWDFG